jgi:signal transduction histidine kinase
MSRRPAADLFVVPIVALLETATTAGELAEELNSQGLSLTADWIGQVLVRAAQLGLARVASSGSDGARYVTTSLGQRAAGALVTDKPELAVGLEELERLRTDLLATVGHELRTPLTAIRTSVGLLLDPGVQPTADQRQQLLSTIGRSADRMQTLLTELLDFARLRSGAVPMERMDLDAGQLARDVAAVVAPMAAARDQRIVLYVPAEPVRLHGDGRRLEQALLNLAANAQKFSPSGAEIVLRVTAADGLVRWSVTDNGPGIRAGERERLFERFFVGSSDRHTAGGGAGIGLPTAMAIAQAHGGTVEVESEVGQGSTFHLAVPTSDVA